MSKGINSLMDNMTPETLAKLTVAIANLASPDCDADEITAINTLSNAAFDAGQRNSGMEFNDLYFDAVIAAE